MNAQPSRNRRQSGGFVQWAGAFALLAIGVAAWPQSAGATIYLLQANLDGLQESPPNLPPPLPRLPPTGVAIVRYNDVTNTFESVQSAFDGLTLNPANEGLFPRVIDSHFHFLPAGQLTGPVIVPVFRTNYTEPVDGFLRGDFTNVPFANAQGVNVADVINPQSGNTFETDLLNNRFYYNVHSNQHPGGEIRGQLMVIPEPAGVGLLALAASGLLWRRRQK